LPVILCALVFPAAVQADESESLVVRDSAAVGTAQPPEPEAPKPPTPFYIGPRIGPSTVTGYLGVEAQYGHIALGGGLLFDDGYALGAKYLFSPYPGSLYIFGSYFRVKTYDEGDDADQKPTERIITNMGVGLGWQKRWRNGTIASIGLGPSYYDDPKSDSHLMVVLDLSIGYAFAFGNRQ
jgi:hypothetical protein